MGELVPAGPSALVGRLVPAALDAWVRSGAARPGVDRGAIELQLSEIREGLAPAGVIEGLLVERILVCWLALDVAEWALAQRTVGEHDRGSGLYWSRRVDGASRRYLASVRALAQIRKLGIPDLHQHLHVG